MSVQILTGDCRERLADLPDASVHCCVTSPPYYGLRDYGHDGQLGLEETPEAYVAGMVEVFRDVRRVLRDDGTLWLNIGDSYNAAGRVGHGTRIGYKQQTNRASANGEDSTRATAPGLKPKDLIGIPWRLAFALQADGWWLRSDIIWHKPNPMPESVTDRPTSAHEHIFLLAKSERYYYDAEAIAEPFADERMGNPGNYRPNYSEGAGRNDVGTKNKAWNEDGAHTTRNRRNVWTVATKPFSEAHFAVYPPDLIEPCIKAGTSEHGCCPECGAPWERVVERERERVRLRALEEHAANANASPQGGYRGTTTTTTTGWAPTCDHETDPVPCTVLDPFGGAGTTGLVADRLGRDAVLIELNPEYAAMAERRIYSDAPMFADVEAL